ncbi:uncharacterized protein LOC130497760 [Raphanus sativus]|uniref:Uncharacterized protein LOC130497760 n=1 Tax=Raphanus sativus TaxID=3726 RepID=A0A9W3C636_RAPSA|nr:uncharacterized protein LOC130497760 [Raphanus sativus]
MRCIRAWFGKRQRRNLRISRTRKILMMIASSKNTKKRLAELREAAKVRRLCKLLLKFGLLIAECGLLLGCLEELASRYPRTKFVKIISTGCIPNYPDCNLPTLLVSHIMVLLKELMWA